MCDCCGGSNQDEGGPQIGPESNSFNSSQAEQLHPPDPDVDDEANEVTSQGSCDFSEYEEFFNMQFMFGQLQSTDESAQRLSSEFDAQAAHHASS